MTNKNTKILLYGINGFIGKNLVAQLIKSKFDVYAISSSKNIEISIKDLKFFKKLKILRIADLNSYIFDFAILNSSPNNKENNNKIFNESFNLYEKILHKLNKKITLVYLSSGIVCFENKLNKSNYLYRSYKKRMENLIKNYSFKHKNNYKILRIYSSFGPYMPLQKYALGYLILSILKNKKLLLKSDGEFYRDFVFVNDLIKIIKSEIKIDRSLVLDIRSKKYYFKNLCNKIYEFYSLENLISFGKEKDQISEYYAKNNSFVKSFPNFLFENVLNSISVTLHWFKNVNYIKFKIKYEK